MTSGESKLSSIVSQLREEETRLGEKVEELKKKLGSVESERKQITQALAAIEGKPKVRKERQKSTTKAATKAEVIAHVEAILAEQELVEKADLKELVQERVVASGKSKMGLALRIKEALADSRFVDTPGGYRLASENLGSVAAK